MGLFVALNNMVSFKLLLNGVIDFVDLFLVLIFLVVGFVNGFFSSMSGGGSLFALPMLLLIGLPAQVAIATNTFSTLGSAVGCVPKYLKEKKVNFSYLLPCTVLSLIGTFIGANLLLAFPKELLTSTIVVILTFIAVVFIFNKKIGVMRKEVTRNGVRFGYFLYFLTSILAGFFLAGTGILIICVMVAFMGFTFIEANATRQVLLIPTVIMSTLVFSQKGLVDFNIGLILMAGMVIGGLVGARLAIKKGDEWVKRITVIVVIITVVKLIFF